jgi:phosphatidylserine decarboxylase
MKKHLTSFISQQFGKFASHEFTPRIQNVINQGYVRLMGLDMSEFQAPETYRSLNQLFTRKLREPRSFSLDAEAFISPCDCLITELGDLDETKALQIKGMAYCVDELLGDHVDEKKKKRLRNGQFINFYLSPKDYHRYHVPTNLKVLQAVHIPGKLYPVNLPSLNKRVDLFVGNERVVLECETEREKLFYMVLVGALNVGKMQIGFEPRIKTNADAEVAQSFIYEDLYLDKGDDFGCFEMGSTIVIISEKKTFDFSVSAKEKVRFSQTIATSSG